MIPCHVSHCFCDVLLMPLQRCECFPSPGRQAGSAVAAELQTARILYWGLHVMQLLWHNHRYCDWNRQKNAGKTAWWSAVWSYLPLAPRTFSASVLWALVFWHAVRVQLRLKHMVFRNEILKNVEKCTSWESRWVETISFNQRLMRKKKGKCLCCHPTEYIVANKSFSAFVLKRRMFFFL